MIEPTPLCTACNKPGAGSTYKGGVYHLTCKLEAKLDAGELTVISKPTQPRLRGTGNGNRRLKHS